MDNRLYTIPNLLTLGRFILVPFVAWRLLEGDLPGAFVYFVIAAVTDFFDGYLARLLNQKSALGAWLDPLADKAMLLTVILLLADQGILPIWLALIVVLRDVTVLVGAAAWLNLTGHLDVAPTLGGKVATFAEFVLISLLLGQHLLSAEIVSLFPLLILITAALATFSGTQYVWRWTLKTRTWLRSHPPVR
jgi:cardiolipin synthase